jgi:hypothetical protein
MQDFASSESEIDGGNAFGNATYVDLVSSR